LHRRHWLLFQSGAAHARLRKLITKVFTPRAVQALVPRIERLVQELLVQSLERGSIEVIGELAYPLPATVICELLGVPEADRGQNRAWAAAIAPTLDPIATDEQIAAAEAAMREWDAYTRELMAERRRTPGHALLDDMLAVEEDGTRLTSDEIAANTTFLFLAGHETTTNLIGNGLFALMRHPDQLAILRADPGLVGGAIEELLRFDSPVQFTARVAAETTQVEGIPRRQASRREAAFLRGRDSLLRRCSPCARRGPGGLPATRLASAGARAYRASRVASGHQSPRFEEAVALPRA
jgi:cytochrome P450